MLCPMGVTRIIGNRTLRTRTLRIQDTLDPQNSDRSVPTLTAYNCGHGSKCPNDQSVSKTLWHLVQSVSSMVLRPKCSASEVSCHTCDQINHGKVGQLKTKCVYIDVYVCCSLSSSVCIADWSCWWYWQSGLSPSVQSVCSVSSVQSVCSSVCWRRHLVTSHFTRCSNSLWQTHITVETLPHQEQFWSAGA